MSLITRGFAKINRLIQRGFGKTLIIVVSKKSGGGLLPIPYIPYKEINKKNIFDLIKTRKIKIPDEKKDIIVDVLLIKHTGDISVEAVLKKVTGKYTEIKVYVEDEVRIYD